MELSRVIGTENLLRINEEAQFQIQMAKFHVEIQIYDRFIKYPMKQSNYFKV